MPTFTPGVVPADGLTEHRYFHVIGSSVYAADANEVGPDAAHFIGVLDGVGVWAVDVPKDEDPSDGAALDLFSMFARVSEEEWSAAGRAVQIAEWARTHKFCGRCGTPTEAQSHERAMKCPTCGLLA